jgi:hypothetical protein
VFAKVEELLEKAEKAEKALEEGLFAGMLRCGERKNFGCCENNIDLGVCTRL